MSTRRFEGRVAVVTGGASGIGLAISRRLVAEGARAVLGDVNGAALARVCAELGPSAHGVVCDVRVEAQVEALANAAVSRFGALDLGFNCAGLGVFGEIVDLSEADWDTVLDICLKGVFFSVKHEARRMIASGRGGAIVNIASLNSHVPAVGMASYTSAKAGVEMLGRNAALELARHGIRVNTVSPGLTDTPATAGFRDVAGLEGAFMERIPMRRWGTPDEIARAALFLASDDAGYISGSNLFVDGAWETTTYPDLARYRAELASGAESGEPQS
ncbi:MAG: SDR family oxidoreductase [Deltaproteobacteria bacterium]|nr:SDR family oxidoreductase [Deltaproteobacteria bacterium]